jgi:LacI family transcriptional regulator
MKHIAEELGVSVVTVSKVLRNHSDIGEETRARVLRRVKELNYHPNLAARSLVTGRSFLIGLVVPDLLHSFFAEVAKSLSQALMKKGYYLIIVSSEEDPRLEEQEIDHLLGRRLDALIIASASANGGTLRHIESQGIPYILIDRECSGLQTNFIGIDDEKAGVLATTHLIEIGCKRIAHIRGPENSPGIGRLRGYQKTLDAHGITGLPEHIVSEQTVDVNARSRGRDAMAQLLRTKQRPDGVFCYNDPLAIGAIDYILDAGLRVPEDIAVIGCGNLYFNSSLSVPLSSIDQRTSQIGQRAARLAFSLIEAKTAPRPRSIILEPELVTRRSTARTPDQAESKRRK